jgi:hypothetical protein
MARKHQPPFRATSQSLYQKWNSVYDKTFLKSKDYEDANAEQLGALIRKHMAEFMGDDLPKIMERVREEEWVWQQA